MPTDIYGCIEVRHPGADEDWYDAEPWVPCMSLAPLYPVSDLNDYVAFGCLFGVRNWLGFPPVAPERGLPVDVSASVRADYEESQDPMVHGSTWVSWAELRDLDMSVRPVARGLLHVHRTPSSYSRYRVDDEWPGEIVEKYGVPPIGASPVDAPYGRWRVGDVVFEYRMVTRLDVLGPGSGWEHVFAVMRALAQRFGDDGVRLVVWFD
jgi:hypothetical protein